MPPGSLALLKARVAPSVCGPVEGVCALAVVSACAVGCPKPVAVVAAVAAVSLRVAVAAVSLRAAESVWAVRGDVRFGHFYTVKWPPKLVRTGHSDKSGFWPPGRPQTRGNNFEAIASPKICGCSFYSVNRATANFW